MWLLARYGLQMELCWLLSGHSLWWKGTKLWGLSDSQYQDDLFVFWRGMELNEDKTTFMPFIGARNNYEMSLNGAAIGSDYRLWITSWIYQKKKKKKQKQKDLPNNKCLHILYCLLIIPYMTHLCGGYMKKKNIDPIRAIRIINKAYCKSINQMVYWVLCLKILRRCVFKNIGNNTLGWE